jgi:very-short-patch-repair endonuclease
MAADPLAGRILEHLRQHPGQLAREIAQALSCDKSEVNSRLYGVLGAQVSQDRQYRWSLAKTVASTTPNAAPVRSETDLARLCRYYLDCISFDDEGGASIFAESRFGPSHVELSQNPLVSGSGLGELLTAPDAQRLLASIRQHKKRLGLTLGYPCYLKRIRSKKGWEGMMIEPLFLFPISSPEPGRHQHVVDVDAMSLNFPLLARLSGLEGAAGLEEGLALMAELGAEEGPPPEWDEFFARLHRIRPDWMWLESPDPKNLASTPSLATAQDVGLYNRAVLFGKEQSIYTVGLEKELAKLQSISDADLARTALGSWTKGQVGQSGESPESLLEVIPLNSEQREAVRRGLAGPLTVITGPPGTGKSQVVTSLLLNAAWKGQKVLFASKNNKAVDVVETRVNALGPRPILLRLGADKVRAELAEYLLRLLSAVTTPEDTARYQENLRQHTEVQHKIAEMEKAANNLVKLRNRVDELERKVEPLRAELGAKLFGSCRLIDTGGLERAVSGLGAAVENADRAAQPLLTRLTWWLVKQSRWSQLRSEVDKHRGALDSIGVPVPALSEAPVDDVGPWRGVVQRTQHIRGRVLAARSYADALDELKLAGELPKLHADILALTDKSQDLCQKLWSCWLALQPAKLTQADRRILGDYAAVLQLIVAANDSGSQLGKEVFRRYYELFPKIAGLLPCWAVTSLSANGRIPLEPGFFDLVVIDEASQCDIASALPLLFRAKSAVIIGDPRQLRHISSLAPHRDRELLGKHGLVGNFAAWSYSVVSLFDLASRLCAGDQITVLRDHHRSHHDIIEFSNRTFYEGCLRIATKHDRLRPVTPKETGIRWIPVDGEAQAAVGGGATNHAEARAVVDELKRISVDQRYSGSVGVVTPFRAQANLIREMVQRDQVLSDALARADFLAETAHRFQGDERDIMVFSPVVGRGLPGGSAGFLSKTPNLFNVAITRARCCLIVTGSVPALASSGVKHMEAFAYYFKELEQRGLSGVTQEYLADHGPRYPKVARPELVSEWEHIFYEKLYLAGIRTIPQFSVENYLLDLALIDGRRRLDIEVDGERYHRNWDGELLVRDRLRNQRLVELGWDVQRFWVYQIRDDIDGCVTKVTEWLARRE